MSTRASRHDAFPRAWLFLAASLCACGAGTQSPSRVRFANAPVAWRVADDTPAPKPRSPRFLASFYHFDQLVYRPLDRALGVPRYHRADNVNALGEVPTSSWFENRIGRRALGVDAVRDGPLRGKPAPRPPFQITKIKSKQGRHTFMAKDARGDRYFLKFDRAGLPVAETAAHVIVNRLLWAAGYRVADDSIVHVWPADFVVGPGAMRTSEQFSEEDKPLTRAYLDKVLARMYRRNDGRVRVLASAFLPGKPLGGFSQTGVRQDDRNDRVAHERRRELRGMYVFYSWLKSTDMKTDNTIDMWQKTDGNLGVVRHYLIDFGMSLGVNGLALGTRGDGYERFFSWPDALSRMFTFGAPWYWEKIGSPGQPHVGALEVEGYRPGAHKTRVPYFPWASRDRFDTFWAAKILARIEERHIRAAVESAQYPDPRSGDYVVAQLAGRRTLALRHWFAKLAPIDAVVVADDGRLCFTDLGVEHGVLDAPSYSVTPYDFAGRQIGRESAMSRSGSRYCVAGLPRGQSEGGYTIAVVRGRRGARTLPAVDVHFARNAGTRAERIIGLRRH